MASHALTLSNQQVIPSTRPRRWAHHQAQLPVPVLCHTRPCPCAATSSPCRPSALLPQLLLLQLQVLWLPRQRAHHVVLVEMELLPRPRPMLVLVLLLLLLLLPGWRRRRLALLAWPRSGFSCRAAAAGVTGGRCCCCGQRAAGTLKLGQHGLQPQHHLRTTKGRVKEGEVSGVCTRKGEQVTR